MRIWRGGTARIVLIFLVAAISVQPLLAQTAAPKPTVKAPTDKSRLNDVVQALSSVRTFGQVAVSPDGEQLAWVENAGSGKSAIYIAKSAEGSVPHRITAASGGATRSEDSPAWSPDSKRLAFLSDAVKPGQPQLYVMNVSGGGSPKRLTDAQGLLASPGWSPDGKRIALLWTENAERAAGPLVAETPRTGVITETVSEQRLAVIDSGGGKLEALSPEDMYVYEYDWAPDGKHFVTTAAPGNGDDNWYVAQVYTLDASGGAWKSIHKPALQIADPIWSPDGKSIAFISGLMSDEVSVGGDVFIVPAQGGEARNVTPTMKASASWVRWMPDGQNLVIGQDIDGYTGIATVKLSNGAITNLWQGPEQLSQVSVAADGTHTAMLCESFTRPVEVWTGPVGAWHQVTKVNSDLKPLWGEARSVHWTNDDFHLQGWLLYPRGFDPAKKYPMVVQVHGGPGAMAHSSWPGSHSYAAVLSSAGYFVFFPNPRGSFGEGEAFTRANVKDFGYGDFRDILAGVEYVVHNAPVEPEHVGIAGWSYGGYMTMWAVTQTNRFAAAFAGAGIANYQSYYGQNQIDQWMIPFFGASVYDDPQVYARSSPITFIKKVKTPTLVIVGDSDGECPPPQSLEFWHALKTLGVKTELVIYEHEGHSFADPKHQRDVIERVVSWFDTYLR
ncbi:MAG TPA: S9 family peptidase [Candidatus Angelobacter sp.]|jgi:dipeptidyl aminopeptidase/acylaminoacyl peptidase|nr:S9 family peptidase [Candidatus Angelobacter sp.]